MASFSIPADFYKTLSHHVGHLSRVAEESAAVAQSHVFDEVQRRAAESPRWIGVADYIDTWDDQGRMWVGVRAPQFVSQAYAAEYGTEDFPPDPILRTLDSANRMAATKAEQHFTSQVGAEYIGAYYQ